MSTPYTYRHEALNCMIGDQTIRGHLYLPNAPQPMPIVLFSHGFGGNYRAGISVAEKLAPLGIAVYAFDFRGGGPESASDGNPLDTSVVTQADDLTAVLRAAENWQFVDQQKIVLFGESQGGMVSAMVASRFPNEIDGLVLLYPAFVIHDDRHKEFKSLEEVPAEIHLRHWMFGYRYVADVWDYDVYKDLPKYTKPVIIVHGDKDSIVPIAYSEKAAQAYPDAEFFTLPGAEHGFKQGPEFDQAMIYVEEYLKKIGVLASGKD